jgi:molybdopterin/thiamine biosynthesis adenylyltransferase
VEALDRRFEGEAAHELARRVDLLVDGSDNFPTKFLANDAALAAGKPLVHGGVLGYTAQVLTVLPGKTGCLRCLFEGPPDEGVVPSTEQVGILGAMAGFAGSLMGAEAVRLLRGEQGAYAGRLLVYESRRSHSRLVPVALRQDCPCGLLAPRPEPEPQASPQLAEPA